MSRCTLAQVRPALERLARVIATFGLGVLGMLAAHCGGYQLASVLQLDVDAAPVAPAHAVHVGHHLQGGHHLVPANHASPAVGDHHAGHGHVLPLASGAFLLVLLVVLVAAVLAGRRARFKVPCVRTLLAAQLGLFTVMEVGERLWGGLDPTAALGERRVLLALLLQLPVAVLVVRLSRRVATLVAMALGARGTPSHPSTCDIACPVAEDTWPPTWCFGLTAAPRGPPAERFITT